MVTLLGVAIAPLWSPVRADSASAFHLGLKRSEPAKDAIVTKAPTAITLWFTERPELAVTTISLLDANSAKVVLAPPRLDVADGATVIADVKGGLPPGVYRVQWKTSSHDGHPVRGEFAFTVRAAK
jgi:hypothetical protein